VVRRLITTVLAAASVSVAWRTSSAEILCAKQMVCPAHTWLAQQRTPYWGTDAFVQAVPTSARTLFSGDQTTAFTYLCSRSISVWASLSDTLPHDRVGVAGGGLWTWAPQSLIEGNGNRRSGIAAAATQNSWVDAQQPCKITSTVVESCPARHIDSLAFEPATSR
jgi:hypothetical protein